MLFIMQSNDFLDLIAYPPGSMIFILVFSITIAFITTLITRWLTDTKSVERKQKLIKEHNERKEKIIKLAETDPERYRKQRKKWERKDEMVKKTSQGISMQRLKPTCITMLPMLILFFFIRLLFENNGIPLPVAASPMNANDIPFIGDFIRAGTDGVIYPWTELAFGRLLPVTWSMGWIGFTAWYFLCSLGMNTLIQRILKIQTQASGGMEQMFGGSKAKAMEFPDV